MKRTDENSTMAVAFDGRIVSQDMAELGELSLAYAASIHKSQGSEYPVVCSGDSPRPAAPHASGAEPAL